MILIFFSEAVLGLLSTIYPLEYQTNYKPYFTIYDPEYREVQDMHDKKIAKCAVMGVTNPLFLKVINQQNKFVNQGNRSFKTIPIYFT